MSHKNKTKTFKDGFKGDEVVTCPLNNTHRLMKHKLQTHLVKCKRFHMDKDSGILECKFNPCHLIDKDMYEYHLNKCPDRYEVDKYLYPQESVDTEKYPIYNEHQVIADENWDDLDQNTYNPEAYVVSKPLLRKVDTLSASVRRNFQIENRYRCRELTSNPSAGYKPEDGVHLERKPKTARERCVTAEELRLENSDPDNIQKLVRKIQDGFVQSTEVVQPKEKENNPPPLSQILGATTAKYDEAVGGVGVTVEDDWCKIPFGRGRKPKRNKDKIDEELSNGLGRLII